MINRRPLARAEITNLWTIDRSEIIDAVYYLDHGILRLRPERHDVRGWPPGESEKYTPLLEEPEDIHLECALLQADSGRGMACREQSGILGDAERTLGGDDRLDVRAHGSQRRRIE